MKTAEEILSKHNVTDGKKIANEYAERVCNGEFPITYTREQAVKHTANDFMAGYNYKPSQVVTEKEVSELQELEDTLTTLIGDLGSDAISGVFLLWMEKRNEINHNRISQLEDIINKSVPTPVTDKPFTEDILNDLLRKYNEFLFTGKLTEAGSKLTELLNEKAIEWAENRYNQKPKI